MIEWSVEKIVNGEIVAKKEGIMTDAYSQLIQAKDDTRGAAKVSVNYGQSTEFAREKYGILVTLTCDQNDKTITRAAELGMQKVKELNELALKGMFG